MTLIVTLPAFSAPAARSVTTTVRADIKSGKLIRTAAFAPRAMAVVSESPSREDLTGTIDRIAGEQGVESHLVHSVIQAESNYQPLALSPKGAQGLMQLIPSTAKRFGVANSFDPAENIEGGVRYLRFLLDYYKGDYPKTIAAYNAGEAAVDKYNGIPPYPETRNYVNEVARNLKASRAKKKPAVVKQAPPPLLAANETPLRPIEASLGTDGRLYYRTP